MELGIFEWKDFPALSDSNELENYIKYHKPSEKEPIKYQYKRAYNHKGFYHYTSLDNIDKILGSNSLLLSVMGKSNDLMEGLIPNSENLFSFCFSTGENENLPLWYLYSGINGQGGRLGFTKSMIYQLIHNGKYSLVQIVETIGKDNKIQHMRDLDIHNDIEISFQDVVYAKENAKYVDLKYNTMTNHNKIKVENFKYFKANNAAFIKSLVWYYEKETRIVVHLKPHVAETMDKNEKYKVKLSFEDIPDIRKKLKLCLAPELAMDENNKELSEQEIFYKITKSNKNIETWLIDTSKFSKSEYSGQVKMQLCRNCNVKQKNNSLN